MKAFGGTTEAKLPLGVPPRIRPNCLSYSGHPASPLGKVTSVLSVGFLRLNSDSKGKSKKKSDQIEVEALAKRFKVYGHEIYPA